MPSSTSYIVSNPQQTKFLYQNPVKTITTTSHKRFATPWDSYEKAINVINCLPKHLKNEIWQPVSLIATPKPTNTLLPTNTSITSSNTETVSSKTSPEPQELNPTPSTTSSVISYLVNLQNRHQYLEDQLAKCNAETQDVLHYIEFNKLNAFQGFKIYKLLKEIRIDRRVIKDELAQVEAILSQLNIQQLINKLPPLDNRKYVPRELPELFEKGV